jgi:hypothetical protein
MASRASARRLTVPNWFKSGGEKEAIAEAETAYRDLIEQLRADPSRLSTLGNDLRELRAAGFREHLGKKQAEQLRQDLIAAAADTVLADDVLTEQEQDALLDALEQLGFTTENADQIAPGLMNRLVVAMINDGRLPLVDDSRLPVHAGEVVHAELQAALMKYVPIHEYRGGSRGVSIRIMKGVSYRTGAQRGHIVTVGTQLQVADAGTLTVTSERVVFAGRVKTLTFLLKNLVSLEVFEDGLQLGVSNRQTTSLFKFSPVDPVAAVISHAAAKV